jgi:hypothetical protein
MSSSTAASRQSGIPGNTQTRDGSVYEQPVFAPDTAAQHSLGQLDKGRKFAQLDEKLKEAQAYLAEAAVEVNDRLTMRETVLEKHKYRQASENDNDSASVIATLESAPILHVTERLTERMDETIRRIIDAQQSIEAVGAALRHTTEAARQGLSTQSGTQASRVTRSAAHTNGQGRGDDVDAMDVDSSFPDFTPTDPAGGTQAITSPLQIFRERIESDQIRYQRLSLTERYADNNSYRDFRRTVHDARHPDDDVPMPHHTEWFVEAAPPPPGVTAGRPAGSTLDDGDDDIAISRATISTKCPLTLVEFVKPLTSTKCPHSFESEAVLGMIRQATNRTIQCPVTGCRESLRENDLQVDTVLKRKIQRLQRSKQMVQDDDDDADGHGFQGSAGSASQGIVHVIDDFEPDDIVTSQETPQLPKNEPRPSRA